MNRLSSPRWACNMTSELLSNAFAHGRKGFAVETMTGSSQKIIGGLVAHKPDVALISEELQDGPQAGDKVLQKLQDSHRIPAIMLLQSSKPKCVGNAFLGGARGITAMFSFSPLWFLSRKLCPIFVCHFKGSLHFRGIFVLAGC
jgi:hypothetical protein